MSDQFRVLITDRAWPDCSIERQILSQVGAEVVEAPNGDEPTLCALARDVDAIGACWAKVTSAVIRHAPRCRAIARFGIGLDNICIETATARNIPVTFVPDYCVPEVSDHALALVLACSRKVAFYHARTKAGEYQLQAGPTMRRLSGQVLGLIGLGRIGRAVVPKARAFGLDVVAWTLSGNDHQTGCRMLPLETLLEVSDFVSLHVPLAETSRHLIGREQLQRMKPTAYLINTSRGPLVDPQALSDALRGNWIAGAALDVFDPEPPDLLDPLYADERVIVTPHAAFFSAESVEELRTRAASQIAEALQGRRPEHVVNPQVYA